MKKNLTARQMKMGGAVIKVDPACLTYRGVEQDRKADTATSKTPTGF